MVSRMQAVEWALKPLLARGLSQGKEGAGFWPRKQLGKCLERGTVLALVLL